MSSAAQQPSPRPTAFSEWPRRFVARVTLQLRAPFVIRAGGEFGSGPADFVRDANGLPALPGTSLCGILRHACLEHLGRQGHRPDTAALRTAALFGASADTEGAASRLTLSWARIHDSADRPVDGLLAPQDPRLTCPVLAEARVGCRRQHVRINSHGTADGRGKFEESVVSAGHRFSFDLVLRGDAEDTEIWQTILDLLHDPDLRVGAGTRRGFGAFSVHRLDAACFDLRRLEDFRAFCSLPKRLDVASGLPPANATSMANPLQVAVTLRGLRPTTPWLFGGGAPEGDESIAPMTQTVIRWQNNRGAPSPPTHYVPASAVKGSLAHRLAWHYNRITGQRAGNLADTPPEETASEAVVCLFGIEASSASANVAAEAPASAGRRGLLLLDEIALSAPAATQEIHHVSLDRFSGGARSGLLFSERVIAPDVLRCDYRIALLVPPGTPPIAAPIRHAFAAVLEDIRKARIAFGGGSGRGNGRFRCDTVEWDDAGRWIETGEIGVTDQGAPLND